MIFPFAVFAALMPVLVCGLGICKGSSLLGFDRIGAGMLFRVPAKNALVC